MPTQVNYEYEKYHVPLFVVQIICTPTQVNHEYDHVPLFVVNDLNSDLFFFVLPVSPDANRVTHSAVKILKRVRIFALRLFNVVAPMLFRRHVRQLRRNLTRGVDAWM